MSRKIFIFSGGKKLKNLGVFGSRSARKKTIKKTHEMLIDFND